jgi:uncharacterized protein DUF6152
MKFLPKCHRLGRICLAAVSLSMLSVPLLAHHGSASYDTSKAVTVTGTVTDYVWANPHVFVKVDAKDTNGNVVHWLMEAQNPVTQTNVGWTSDLFKPGDEVTIECFPAKNGRPIGRIGFTTRIVINGKEFKGKQLRP